MNENSELNRSLFFSSYLFLSRQQTNVLHEMKARERLELTAGLKVHQLQNEGVLIKHA